MPAGEGFAVSPPDLHAHATRVDAVAEEIATAQEAGRAVRVDTGAYGQLCVMVPLLLGVLDDAVVRGMTAAQTSVRGTADRLRSSAGTYQAAEETNRAAIDRLSGSV